MYTGVDSNIFMLATMKESAISRIRVSRASLYRLWHHKAIKPSLVLFWTRYTYEYKLAKNPKGLKYMDILYLCLIKLPAKKVIQDRTMCFRYRGSLCTWRDRFHYTYSTGVGSTSKVHRPRKFLDLACMILTVGNTVRYKIIERIHFSMRK